MIQLLRPVARNGLAACIRSWGSAPMLGRLAALEPAASRNAPQQLEQRPHLGTDERSWEGRYRRLMVAAAAWKCGRGCRRRRARRKKNGRRG